MRLFFKFRYTAPLFTTDRTEATPASIDRSDKEDVTHIYNVILLSYKRSKIMPFAEM